MARGIAVQAIGSKRGWTIIASTLMLAACGRGETPAPSDATAGIPAEVALQTTSDLAVEPAGPIEGVEWRARQAGGFELLELVEADGHVSIQLGCGGQPPRLAARLADFTPTRAGEPMRLAIGPTEIAMATRAAPRGVADGSVAEAVIPPNLGALMVAAPAIDVVQGAQRIGRTQPPAREMALAFDAACQAHAR